MRLNRRRKNACGAGKPNNGKRPSSLRALTSSARRTPRSGGCDYVGTADVPSCIRVGPVPNLDWDPRTASYEAARTVMSDSSALASQVNVIPDTVHYLPGSATGRGVWTALLDGSGTRPAEGIAVWDGQSNTASVCQFQGSDSLNRAFGGSGADSLRNLIAEKFPSLIYVDHDVWGYCAGAGPSARPVIVMPVTRQIGWKDRTVLQPAGILVLRGSPGGTPSMTYQRTVRAGEYPGPLTPRNSASQTVVAYAVERADEVTQGLNPVTIYVQSDGANPVSMSVLESRMTTYINQVAPGLLTSGAGGQLQEIIPYGRGMWRGFVDIGEVTQDYIDLSSQANVTPRFLSVSGHITGQAPGASDSPAR